MSEKPKPVDLSTVDRKDLIAELMRRHHAVVVLLEQSLTNTTEKEVGRDCFAHAYSGGVSAAIGMCERFKVAMMHSGVNIVRPGDKFHDDDDLLSDNEDQ